MLSTHSRPTKSPVDLEIEHRGEKTYLEEKLPIDRALPGQVVPSEEYNVPAEVVLLFLNVMTT